jgi:hypothetical protein
MWSEGWGLLARFPFCGSRDGSHSSTDGPPKNSPGGPSRGVREALRDQNEKNWTPTGPRGTLQNRGPSPKGLDLQAIR